MILKSVLFGRNLDLLDILIWKDTRYIFKNLTGWSVCDTVFLLLHFLLAFMSKLVFGIWELLVYVCL